MSRELTTARLDMPLKETLDLMLRNGFTGLPVLGEDDAVVGVVTLTDVARYLGKNPTNAEERGTEFYGPDQLKQLVHALELWEVTEGLAADVMSRQVLSVRPETTVQEAARYMLGSRIHRVLVTDGAGALVGLVSSLDVMDYLTS